MTSKENNALPILGSTEYVDIAGIKNVPAKIDTGADSSAIWASHIRVTKDGVLHFCLFDEGSSFYTGETLDFSDFDAAVVRSSSGHTQVRYRVRFVVALNGKRIKVLFNLSDRGRNKYPILIGRRSILNKFLVDVSQNNAPVEGNKHKTRHIRQELMKDPYLFHREYVKSKKGGVK